APAPAPAAPPRAPEPAPPPRPAAPAAAPPAEGGQVESIEERIRRRSSPLVRKIAQENSIEIGDVEGTGIHNRVTKNDVLSYLENRKVAGPVPAAAPAPSRAATAPAEIVGRAAPAEGPAPRPPIPLPRRRQDG